MDELLSILDQGRPWLKWRVVGEAKGAGGRTWPLLVITMGPEDRRCPAVGYFGGANWAPNLDNPQSKAFVAAYEKKYGSVPGTYAMQAYDAALMIDAAVKRAKGDLKDKDALRAGLKAAEFQSLRGNFKIGNNNYPIQDFYLVKAAKRPDGKYETQIAEKIFSNYQDNYAAECKMK